MTCAATTTRERRYMKTFRVAYLTHKWSDRSGTPRLQYRNVKANSAEEAREIVRDMDTVGTRFNLRYIGMIHNAEEITTLPA